MSLRGFGKGVRVHVGIGTEYNVSNLVPPPWKPKSNYTHLNCQLHVRGQVRRRSRKRKKNDSRTTTTVRYIYIYAYSVYARRDGMSATHYRSRWGCVAEGGVVFFRFDVPGETQRVSGPFTAINSQRDSSTPTNNLLNVQYLPSISI